MSGSVHSREQAHGVLTIVTGLEQDIEGHERLDKPAVAISVYWLLPIGSLIVSGIEESSGSSKLKEYTPAANVEGASSFTVF